MRVEGKVTSVGGVYPDGLDRLEIYIQKKVGNGFPYELGKRVPFTLIIGNKTYIAGIRATERTTYFWVCPDLATASRQSISLSKALKLGGFIRNQAVLLDLFEDGKIRLLPKEEVFKITEPYASPEFSEVPVSPDIDAEPSVNTNINKSNQGTASTFAEENHLRDFLARNLSCIEPGLKLYQDPRGVSGVEFHTEIGRIDILALDANDKYVVIELKVGRGPDSVSGQIMRYMGWVKRHMANGNSVRGIIIAQQVSDKIRYALADIENVSLKEYQLQFVLKDVYLPNS